MRNQFRQAGAALMVSLIMLVVLTLLVISAIRSSNTNLRITGNIQERSEASAAAQQAIEQVIDANNPSEFTKLTAPQNINVTFGAKAYMVTVPVPNCITSKAITNDQLDPGNADDQKCMGTAVPPAPIFDSAGNPLPAPTECMQQQWDVSATVTDAASGASITHNQGIANRVEKGTDC